ncbi:hypothetical protein RFI_01022, partial [Reticulomyxa filosa]
NHHNAVTYAVLLDISSTYDSVWRCEFILKRRLTNSSIKQFNTKVPQGSLLSPLLSLSVYNLLYKAIIRPSLEYACAFWNSADCYKRKLKGSKEYQYVESLEQEEVKLFQKCVRWNDKFTNHNLTLGYQLWKSNHEFKILLAWEIASSNKYWHHWMEMLLSSLQMEVPEIGYPRPITSTMVFPIKAIRQALQYIQEQYKYKNTRVVILSGCKFAVNVIHNKYNSKTYNYPTADCQKIMKDLG